MLNKNAVPAALYESLSLALMSDVPKEKWENVGYAKADVLFIAIAAAILGGVLPERLELKTKELGRTSIPIGSNFSESLRAQPSVQKALDDFFAAEGAQWASIYDKWETALEDKFPHTAIRIWQGVATALARNWRV
ncbi:MAG: hypothetical protein HYU59_11890 [Magnetospirillum gryphiswaldense]|nr:hypothetical protein [Magnetospirillum gryphiswaldense]